MEKNINEEKLIVRNDLNITVKNIGLESKKTNFGITNNIVLILNSDKLSDKDKTIRVKCDGELISLIEMLKELEGTNPIVRKELKEDIFKSEEDANEFVSMFIEIELIDGNIYKTFIKNYKSKTRINILYRYLKNKK